MPQSKSKNIIKKLHLLWGQYRSSPLGISSFLLITAAIGFIVFSARATAPVFTNNEASAGVFNRGATSILTLDITLPPIGSDTFLDGDGTATTGAGTPEAISPGWGLTKLSMPSGTTLCGDTDGSINPPTSIVHDADTSCTSGAGARTVVLGSDVGATNNLAGVNSLIVFKDGDGDGSGNFGDGLWQSGEDIYFDVDASRRYNGDWLDALTVKNTGSALNTDITWVKLWVETSGNSQFDTNDTLADHDCTFNAATSNWECDVFYGFTTQIRLYVTVDFSLDAAVGRTVQMQVPAISDVNANSVFNTGDQGIFFSNNTAGTGNHDGPSSALTNPNIQTIGSGPPLPGFVVAGTLDAAANYTGDPTGKILGELSAFGPNLYIGYGNAHAGGSYHTSINYWDGSAFQTALADFAAEALFVYRVFDDKIHVVGADSSVGGSHTRGRGEPWSAYTNSPDAHRASDIADGVNPGEMFFSGSQDAGEPGDDPTIWRSANDGATWNVSLRPVDNTDGFCCYNMPSFLINYNGAIWADSYLWPAAYKWNGTQWIQQSFHIGTLHRPIIFNGLVVARGSGFSYCCGNPNDNTGTVYKFDGTAASQSLGRSAYDLEVHGSYLYLLDDKRQILRTSDLENFTVIAQAPADSYSIGFVGDDLYVGGDNGKLYKYNADVTALPVTKIPVYRLYNGRVHNHLVTTSLKERNFAIKNLGFRLEGIAFYAVPKDTPGAVPVFRLYNGKVHNHLVTISQKERDFAVKNLGFRYEGIVFWAYPNNDEPDSRAVFRLYNGRVHNHLVTSSISERDFADENLGFRYEGITLYAY